MTVNFYLDSKTNKKGEKAIYCFIRGREIGKTIYINTGKKIDSVYWNEEKQRAKISLTGHPEFNTYLSDISAEIQKRVTILRTQIRNPSADEIKTEILKIFDIEEKKAEFFDVFNLFIKSKSNYSKSMISKYSCLKNLLFEFEKVNKYKIKFSNIDLLFYDKFTLFLQNDKKQINNTVSKYFDLLKTFLHWANERSLNHKTDYLKFKTPTQETDIVYFTFDELLKLYNLDLSQNTELDKIRDVFCFQCFTGARFSDVVGLKRDDIKDRTWNLRVKKTKDSLKIPLNDYALEILNKYKDSDNPLPDVSGNQINQQLKELCKLAEINEPITIRKYRGAERIETTSPKYELVSTHTARRTFITLSLEKGMRPEMVMAISGHKEYKSFKKYIKITDKVKEIEMNNVWKMA
jgi:integrase